MVEFIDYYILEFVFGWIEFFLMGVGESYLKVIIVLFIVWCRCFIRYVFFFDVWVVNRSIF